MNELFNVKDKVVVITGGAGILGKGIAAYLAKEGAKVVVLDRSEEAGKALVDSTGLRWLCVGCDGWKVRRRECLLCQ